MNPDEASYKKSFYMDGLNCDPMSLTRNELDKCSFSQNKKSCRYLKVTTTLSAMIQLMLQKMDLPDQ